MGKPFSQLEWGSTYQFTWIGSTAPSSLSLVIRTASETVTNSVAAIQSGGGNWYAFVTMTTTFPYYPVMMKAEWTATLSTQAGNASPFVSAMLFEVIRTQAPGQARRQG